MSVPLTEEEISGLGSLDASIDLSAAYSRFTPEELTSAPPDQKWIVHPYIPAEQVITIAGPGGGDKTTFTVGLATNRALGLSLPGGARPSVGETVFLSTEDRRVDYLRKLAAQRQHLGDAFNAELVSKRIHFLDCSGVPVRLVRSDFSQYVPTHLPEEIAELLQKKAPRADLLVMETVSRLVGGDESNESLAIAVESAQRICRLAHVAVSLIAHVSQDAGRRGIADAYAARGGSALGDNGRSTLVLTHLTKDNLSAYADGLDIDEKKLECLRVLVHAKSNGALKADPVLLERIGTPYGPVLVEAQLERRVSDDPAAQIERLCTVVQRLVALKMRPTRTRLRDYIEEIGCAKGQLGRLVDSAIEAGRIIENDSSGKGGGKSLALVDSDGVVHVE